MSAAKWRRAMASGSLTGAAAPALALPGHLQLVASEPDRAREHATWPLTLQNWIRNLSVWQLAILAGLIVFPFVVSPFITFQIGAQTLALGLIALSLTFLGGYGGMVSLAQMTVAGIAGYSVAILGSSSAAEISLNWPWYIVVPCALLIATACSAGIAWLSVRTEGIYTIMITLAIGVAFFYLALQNYSLFNGWQGLHKVYPPIVFGINWRDPLPIYFLTLACALASYIFISYVVRSPFGVALQGIRENPRRMESLGFNVVAHRVAAYVVAGFIAAIGGVLFVWYNGLITPGSVGTSWLINILVIAVLGGMRHPIGPFLGALIFVLLQTFAIDVIDRERFNLVIGGVFLAIVLFSPDGLLGLWSYARARFAQSRRDTGRVSSVSTPLRPASRH
ncbi:MAG TPA: branched-chain amino acid ABC transporter permease [Burkholderiaceae bacterium]|nr:branched-chain amino acid ABC transporter permease [Burkholderiaceae bacterium]